jgi:hypothetical protein
MIPVDGIENFPLMGRAIFQKAAKRGDFFQKQVIFRSAWARLMAVHIATVDIVTHVLRSSAAVAFLVGPDGSWINGQVLRANGGMV